MQSIYQLFIELTQDFNYYTIPLMNQLRLNNTQIDG